MSGQRNDLIEQYSQQVRNTVNGHSWIVATGVVVASLSIAKTLRGLGATKVLAMGVSRGTGLLENDDDFIQLLDMGVTDIPDILEAIRMEEQFARLTCKHHLFSVEVVLAESASVVSSISWLVLP